VNHHYQCLLKLQGHLLCQEHSRGGMKTYCWVEPATSKTSGGHREINHEEMTLWAKHMVSKNYQLNKKVLTEVVTWQCDTASSAEHKEIRLPTHEKAKGCAPNT
jgi:hypothetical protein